MEKKSYLIINKNLQKKKKYWIGLIGGAPADVGAKSRYCFD